MPYFAFISGLTKRQPMVVSSIFAVRENALSALPITNGARVMLSTPPAIISSASLERMARAARLDGIQSRTAQTIDGRAGHDIRQPREQRRHSRHVAVVFAGLVGAAVINIVDRGPIDLGVALDQRLDGNRTEIVGTHVGESAAVAADGSADGIADKNLAHDSELDN